MYFNVIFHITPNSCLRLVQLDIDISIRFNVLFFTVYSKLTCSVDSLDLQYLCNRWSDSLGIFDIIQHKLKVIEWCPIAGSKTLRGPPGLANGKPEQCQNATVGPLKDVFTK